MLYFYAFSERYTSPEMVLLSIICYSAYPEGVTVSGVAHHESS